jgi:hypothetical protein
MYKNNVEIVISRYNEDLEWLDEYPFNQFEYIVYNKGDNEDFIKTNVKHIINLPNIGREGHTYLYHIINNYDNLSNIVVFLPGSVTIEYKKTKAVTILNSIIESNYTQAFFKGFFHNSLKDQYNNFTIDQYTCTYKKNFDKNSDTKLKPCKIRPYGKWYTYFFGNTHAHYSTYNGIFSIDKRDIIQHPIHRYNNLIQTVNSNSDQEAGHYMERSWGAIFYPMIYTIKIIE